MALKVALVVDAGQGPQGSGFAGKTMVSCYLHIFKVIGPAEGEDLKKAIIEDAGGLSHLRYLVLPAEECMVLNGRLEKRQG